MRRALRLVALALGASGLAARGASAGEDGAERAFVEVAAPSRPPYVGEAIPLRLRFGIDEAFFRERAVPLFHHATDLPVQVDLPWLDEPAGAAVLPPAEPPEPGRRETFVLNQAVTAARRVPDVRRAGRTWSVFEVERLVAARSAGRLEVPAPVLRFAHASRFVEDALEGRRPVDTKHAAVRGEAVALEVRPLPDAGRPEGFSGAVGRFAVAARADRTDVRVGEPFRLTLSVEGDGNLALLETPRWSESRPEVHVYGASDDRGARRRTIVYDVAIVSADAAGVGPIPFSFFEPGIGYRTVRTDRIDLRVSGPPAGAPEPAPPRSSGGALPPILLAVALALGLLALAALRARRRRGARPADSSEGRPAALLPEGASDRELTDAFCAVLARRLGCPPSAVISPDLGPRLAGTGVPPDAASRAAATLEALVAARYGGEPLAPDVRATASSVAAEVETAERPPRPAG